MRLKDRAIKVAHRKARCAGTRLAPIPDNLFAWLSSLAKKTGHVWPRGVEWKERDPQRGKLADVVVGGLGHRFNKHPRVVLLRVNPVPDQESIRCRM